MSLEIDLAESSFLGARPGKRLEDLASRWGSPSTRAEEAWIWGDRAVKVEHKGGAVAQVWLSLWDDRKAGGPGTFPGRLLYRGRVLEDLSLRAVVQAFAGDEGRIGGDEVVRELLFRREKCDLFLLFDAETLLLQELCLMRHDAEHWAAKVPLERARQLWDLTAAQRAAERASAQIQLLPAEGLAPEDVDACELVASEPAGAEALFANLETLFEGAPLPQLAGLRLALLVVGASARLILVERGEGAWEARRPPETDADQAAAALRRVRTALGGLAIRR